jgi:antitoxin YefM
VVSTYEPLKVTRRAGDDWEREQESLYVLQNNNLTQQIATSLDTHIQATGCQPTEELLDEITDF